MRTIKLLLALLFIWLSPVAGSAQETLPLTEVDLDVNGIRSGTSYTRVIRAIGLPTGTSKKKEVFDECGDGFLKTVCDPGLVVGLLSDADGKNYAVISLKVTSTRWTIAPGIKIGASKQTVQRKFGRPHESTARTLQYVTKENLGHVTFRFRNNKLIGVEMEETLC